MIRPVWAKILLLGCSLGVSACGKSESPPVAKLVRPLQSDVLPSTEGEQPQAAREAAKGGALKCPFPEECDPSVALVSVVSKEGIDRCSGVLISEDQVLTNEHCVRGVENACEGAIFVHFAEIEGVPEQHVGCRKIEQRSPVPAPGAIGMDFAILRLDRSLAGRRKVSLSVQAPQNREPMRIIRVQMQGGKTSPYDGVQEVLRCDVAQSPYSYPSLDSDFFELMTLGDCAIQPGNSGSPIFNSKGELVGLIQGYLRISDEESSKTGFRDALLDESFGQTGVGTRISCVPGIFYDENRQGGSKCLEAPPLSGRNPREFLEQDATAEAPKLPPPQDGLHWKEIETSLLLQKRFAQAPGCGKESRIRVNTLTFRKGINRELRAEWRAEGEGSEKDFEADPGRSLERYLSADGWAFDLPVCR